MNSWDFMIETEVESFEIEKVLAVNITVNCVTPTQHTHTHTKVDKRAAHNLEKARLRRDFPSVACLQE